MKKLLSLFLALIMLLSFVACSDVSSDDKDDDDDEKNSAFTLEGKWDYCLDVTTSLSLEAKSGDEETADQINTYLNQYAPKEKLIVYNATFEFWSDGTVLKTFDEERYEDSKEAFVEAFGSSMLNYGKAEQEFDLSEANMTEDQFKEMIASEYLPDSDENIYEVGSWEKSGNFLKISTENNPNTSYKIDEEKGTLSANFDDQAFVFKKIGKVTSEKPEKVTVEPETAITITEEETATEDIAVLPVRSRGQYLTEDQWISIYAGLNFKLPEGCRFYTEEELLAAQNMTEPLTNETFLELLNDGIQVIDMLAINMSTNANVNVAIQSGENNELGGLSADEYVDALQQELAALGYTFEGTRSKTTLGSREYVTAHCTNTTYNLKQEFHVAKVFNDFILVTITLPAGTTSDLFLDAFSM